MSEDGKVVVGGNNASVDDGSNQNDNGDIDVNHLKQAYEDVTKDMHKYKSEMRQAKAIVAEYEAKLKAIEEQKLVENERWQDLYNREKEERSALEQETRKSQERFEKAVKLSHLKSELGGKIKDAYLQFAKLNEIEIKEDGSIDPESVKRVANDFRRDHPELVPIESKARITNTASPNFRQAPSDKPLSEMSFDEKAKLLQQMKENRS